MIDDKKNMNKIPGAKSKTLTLSISFVQKLLSAYYVCFIYSNAVQTNFIMEVSTMKPEQMQSDPVPYCLIYRLHKKTKNWFSRQIIAY